MAGSSRVGSGRGLSGLARRRHLLVLLLGPVCKKGDDAGVAAH